jgi:type II secretory ATPase GspE/PulE/Tfp pilus assembly ATPase PilB-like protein
MFDPTKLDLNLDDSEKKVEETGKENENQNEATSNQEEAPVIAEEKETPPSLPQGTLSPAQSGIHLVPLSGEEEIPNIKDEENSVQEQDSPLDKGEMSEGQRGLQEDEKQENEQSEEENKIIFNINITSLQDVLNLLIEKEYDFVLLEPETEAIKISFRKEKIEKEAHFIKYPIYSKILLKAKTLTNLVIDETEEVQE